MQPTFYFDLGSPYSYLAAMRINAILPVRPFWQPVLLGGIYQVTGGGSWSQTEQREAGMIEVERRAARYGLPPLRWPDPWPGNMLTAMRVATFAQQADLTVDFALAAFKAGFVDGVDLSDPAAVFEIAAEVGLGAIEAETMAGDQAVKDALRSATELAVSEGVTGVPSVAVEGEVFWGDDQLERVAETIAG